MLWLTIITPLVLYFLSGSSSSEKILHFSAPMGEPTISSVELVNFMCHKHLRLEFRKMMTCIGGRNGSGKSAVMIALGIIFGQRINSLGRGSNVGSVIRTGASQAIITVRLNNHRRYKMAKYGSTITIQKKLRENGSLMCISDMNGTLRAARMQDIRGILAEYEIRFDNPLNFLTQENSKKFLNVSRPEMLYDFYYRGTEFKSIHEELEESKQKLTEMRSKLDDTRGSLKTAREELEIQESNLSFLSIDFDKKLEVLGREEKYAHIREQVDKLRSIKKDVAVALEKRERLEKEHTDTSKRLNTVSFEAVSTGEAEAQIEKISLQKRALENEYEEYHLELTNRVEELNKSRERAMINDLKENFAKITEELGIQRENLAHLGAQQAEAKQEYQDEQIKNEDVSKKRFAYQKQISYLKSNKHDQTTMELLHQFRTVSEEITSMPFRDKVIGPLCHIIKLKDPKWYKAVSIVLKQSLDVFIVFNQDDNRRLFELFKRRGYHFTISQLSSKNVISGLRKPSGCLLLVDVLLPSDPLILNYLVIMYGIEQIALVEDRQKGYSLVKSRREHLDCAYTMQGDKIKLTDGSLSEFKPRDDGRYWFEDHSTRINALENALGSLKMEDNRQNEYFRLITAVKTVTDSVDTLEKQKVELEARIMALEETKDAGVNLEKRVAVLERGIAILKGRMDENEAHLRETEGIFRGIREGNERMRIESEREKERFREQLSKLEREKLVINLQTNESIVRCRDLEAAIENELRTVSAMIKSVAVGSGTKENTPNEQEEVKKYKIAEPDDLFTKLLLDESAINYTIRSELVQFLSNPRNVTDILGERRLVREHQQIACSMKKKEEIEAEVGKMAKEITNCTNIIRKYENLITETEDAIQRRIQKRDEVKEIKTAESAALFKKYTNRCGYEGTLSFDHNNFKLDIQVRVHNSEVGGSKSTLSGGERSISAVCFLLSLWSCCRCPVKILDEFDVFMDVLNRRNAIRMLIEFFKENGTQAIFITPLNTSDLIDDECQIQVISKE